MTMTTNEAESAVMDSFSQFIPLSIGAAQESENPWVAIVPEVQVEEVSVQSQLSQGEVRRAGSVADLLFDAFRQISSLRSVVDPDALGRFFDNAVPAALELCDSSDRDKLRSRIASLTIAAPLTETPAALSVVPDDAMSTAKSAEEKRFAMIVSNISRRSPRETVGSSRADDAMRAAAAILATELASTREELKERIRRIPAMSAPDTDNLFQVLARGISSWDLAEAGESATSEKPDAIRAMQKIMSLSNDPNERATRFRELIMAAVEQLNEGAFFAAVSMLNLSKEVLGGGSLHSTIIERIRTDALREVEKGNLEAFVQDSARYPLLRKALEFFPRLKHEELIDRLHDERDAARRTFVRGLLEVWGPSARESLLERLDREISRSEIDSEYVDELFGLIARIPRGNDADLRKEIEVLGRASAPGQPVDLIKKAVAAISSIRFETAARLLTRRLSELEALPFRTDRSFYQLDELHELIDATIAALARMGTPFALRAIVRHGLGQAGVLGDVRARLRHLSTVDLSIDLDTLSLLWKQIRAELPTKILGAVATKRADQNPTLLIEALRATRAESARKLLREIAAEYPQCDFGHAAANVLRDQNRRATEPPSRENRSGELGYFGLPRVIQSIIDSNATGLLSLADTEQVIRARFWFMDGAVMRAEANGLRGADALYQLLERPVIGSYAFTHRQMPKGGSIEAPLDFARILREGARRHDELQRIVAIVPDDAVFEAGSVRPGRDPRESDPILLRSAWVGATSGESVATWESALAADPWRIRRIVARWVEEGALRATAGSGSVAA